MISLEGVPIHLLISFCNAEELSGKIIIQKLFLALIFPFLIVLGFNYTSTLVGHFVLSSREKMRDRRYSSGDEREGQGRKRNRNESKETEETRASAQRVTNTTTTTTHPPHPRRCHFLIIKYFKVNDNDIRQDIVCLFVCFEVLRPSQPNGVMSSAVSLPNHTFTGQA